MIPVQNTIVSDDLSEVRFACDLRKCKGACCVAGDAGAPLEEEEISRIEDYIGEIIPYMTERGCKVIRENGVFDYDSNGKFVTPLVNDAECAFTNFDEDIAYCAIEKAWQSGRIPFRKPVSCHLYPVRIQQYENYDAVNYHKWHICKAALKKGNRKNVILADFVKDALIRKYGREWFDELSQIMSATK